MKKLILLIAFLPFILTSYGQETYSVIGIVEHFTNTDCPVCGSVNPGFHDIREEQDGYLHLSIHPPKPYPSCALYQANKEDNNVRSQYYEIQGTPTVVFNGTTKMPASQVDASDFNENLDSESPLIIQVEDFRSQNKVEVTVETNGNHPTNEALNVFVYMVEKTVDYTGNSGESIHYNVMRDVVNNNEGTAISLNQSAGERWSEEFNYSIDSDFDAGDIYFITYIQGSNSKKIYNSHSTEEEKVITSILNKDIKSLSVYPNPVRNEINIELPDISSSATLNIYRQDGREVKTIEIFNSENNFSVNVSDLKSGVYIFSIKDGDRFYTQKVIKL